MNREKEKPKESDTTEKLYKVELDADWAETLVVGLEGVYATLKSRLGEKDLPPFSVFESEWSKDWFGKAFSVSITDAGSVDLLETLEEVQERYTEASRTAKQLKAERERLLILSLYAGNDVESVLNASGQSVFDVEKLLNIDAKTAPLVGNRPVPEELAHQIEALIQSKQSQKLALQAIRAKDVKALTQEQRDYRMKYNLLQEFKRARAASRKQHKDDFYGTDFTEDDFETLEKSVQHWFG